MHLDNWLEGGNGDNNVRPILEYWGLVWTNMGALSHVILLAAAPLLKEHHTTRKDEANVTYTKSGSECKMRVFSDGEENEDTSIVTSRSS